MMSLSLLTGRTIDKRSEEITCKLSAEPNICQNTLNLAVQVNLGFSDYECRVGFLNCSSWFFYNMLFVRIICADCVILGYIFFFFLCNLYTLLIKGIFKILHSAC